MGTCRDFRQIIEQEIFERIKCKHFVFLAVLIFILIIAKIIILQINIYAEVKDKKLFNSIQNGDMETVKAINAIDGQKINLKSSSFTPLIEAIIHRKIEIAEYLIIRGADVNAGAGRHNSTPLGVATARSGLSMMRLLLKHGAEVDKDNNLTKTPLMIAAENGDVKAIELLILSGANKNMKGSKSKGTALQYAIATGQDQAVRILLKNGAVGNFDKLIIEAKGRMEFINVEKSKIRYKNIISLLDTYLYK